jgi:hypothetical protein
MSKSIASNPNPIAANTGVHSIVDITNLLPKKVIKDIPVVTNPIDFWSVLIYTPKVLCKSEAYYSKDVLS